MFERRNFAAAAAAASLALAVASGEAAHGAGPDPAGWVAGHAARARLIVGAAEESGGRLVGVQIETDPGWHTYWRNPGDSGVPPNFDWSGSRNLQAANVEWPAPKALPLEFGTSIGYEDMVVFPVVAVPADGSAPVDLRLRLDYAVCLDVCIPLSADLAATIGAGGPGDPLNEDLIDAFRADVPRLQTDAGDPPPRIARSWTEARDGKVVLYVEADAARPAELFVEGPAPFYFAAPGEPEEGPHGGLLFAVEVDGAKAASDLAGARLTATLVAGDGAVEFSWPGE